MTECMSVSPLLDAASLAASAQSYASNNQIDGLGNVTRQSFYLYSGLSDYTVATSVVKAIEAVMIKLGTPAANFAHEYSLNAGHGVPTLNYGVPCSDSKSPYINDCGYDGAGAIFQQLLGSLNPKGVQQQSNWKSLYTYNFIPSGWTDYGLSLGDYTHVYTPSSCQAGKQCRLHIVFHGCSQGESFLNDQFYKNTGYVEWAETNNIVVMFPQAISNPLLTNPVGCFDWWGYTDSSSYATRDGPQMVTFRNMARYLGAQK